jgi:hypothetical protein
MLRTGEAAHVGSDRSLDDFSQSPLDPWNRLQTLELCLKRSQTLGNLPAHMRNRFVQAVNMGELLLDQEPMVRSETALQGLSKQVTFRTHASTREFGQGAWVSFSLQQRLQHRSGRHSRQIDFTPTPA